MGNSIEWKTVVGGRRAEERRKIATTLKNPKTDFIRSRNMEEDMTEDILGISKWIESF